MSSGHTHGLYRPGDTVVHRLPAHCKLVAVIVFVLLVVATPRTAFWAFGAYALLLAGVSTLAQVPPATLLRRMKRRMLTRRAQNRITKADTRMLQYQRITVSMFIRFGR